MKLGNDLGRDAVGKLVLSLALPAMLANLVNVLYSIIDRMYIGHIPAIGEVALAGVGVCGPIVTLLSSFGNLVGIGGSILMAMRMGEGKNDEAKQILANSFLTLLVLSLALTGSFLLLKERLIFWFGGSPVTYPHANTYLTIYTLGTFFSLLAIGLNSFVTAQGFAMVGMLTVLVGALTNIALDSLFILGLGWGVAGAAWATVIAQMASSLFVLCFLCGKRTKIRISFGGYSFRLIRQICLLGLSPFLILATDSVILILMNTMLQHFGGVRGDLLISCATIVQSYMLLITGPLLGISSGTQAIISFNHGAGAFHRVREAERKILLLALFFTGTMFICSRIFPAAFVRMFTDNAAYLDLSVWGIHAFTLMLVPLAFQYVFVDGLTALGRIKVSLFLSMQRKLSFALLLVLLPVLFATAEVIFYVEAVADGCCAIVTGLVYCRVMRQYYQEGKLLSAGRED